jgi:hypothetical protein
MRAAGVASIATEVSKGASVSKSVNWRTAVATIRRALKRIVSARQYCARNRTYSAEILRLSFPVVAYSLTHTLDYIRNRVPARGGRSILFSASGQKRATLAYVIGEGKDLSGCQTRPWKIQVGPHSHISGREKLSLGLSRDVKRRH